MGHIGQGMQRLEWGMVVAIVNLNKHRKRRARAAAEQRAAENRARFGRSRQDRSNDLREIERRKRDIEGKRIE